MNSRLARLGVVAAGILALLGVMTPPAHATLIFSIGFVGTATLAGPGLGYPCTNDTAGGTTTIGADPLYLCPGDRNLLPDGTPTETLEHLIGTGGTPLLTTLPLPHTPEDLVPNGHIHFNHNRHTFTFNFLSCTGAGASVNKLNEADAGTCTLASAVTGTVEGHCGLSGGQAGGVLNLTSLVGAPQQTFQFDLHFNGVTGLLVLTGHVRNLNTGQNGKLVGVVIAVPPTAVMTPGESCANLSALHFTIVGGAGGYARNLTIP